MAAALVIFLLDTSASMGSAFSELTRSERSANRLFTRLDAAKEAIQTTVEQLQDVEVEVVAFADETMLIASGAPRAVLRKLSLAELVPDGGTNVGRALAFAIARAGGRAESTIIFLVTDAEWDQGEIGGVADQIAGTGAHLTMVVIGGRDKPTQRLRQILPRAEVREVTTPEQLRESIAVSAATTLRAPQILLPLVERALLRIQRLEERMDEVLYGRRTEDTEARAAVRALDGDVRDLVWQLSSDADPTKIAQVRYVPVRMYVADPLPALAGLESAADTIRRLGAVLGFVAATDLPAEQGSFWKRFFLRTRDAVTHEEVTSRLAKVEEGLEARYLDKPQSEANKNQAEAVAALVTSMKEIENGCIQVGTLLLVKRPGPDGKPCLAARTLTRAELKRLEQNQAILQQPETILTWLGLPSSGSATSEV